MVYKRTDMTQRKRKEPSEVPVPTTVCYCEGKRELGTLELHCSICRRWFHQPCLKDLKEFYGLPFMVCYVFRCQDCATDKKESWTPKQTNFAHMCVMAMANMTYNYFAGLDEYKNDVSQASKDNKKYFNFEKEIVAFFEEQWESLTNMPRRVKNSWHQTLLKTLTKETELFSVNPENENEFALNEQNLLDIGPLHESIKKLGRRPPASQPIPAADSDKDDSESGPKTRGAARRRAESSSRTSSLTPTKASTPASGTDAKSDKPMGLLKKGTLDANSVVEGSDGSMNFPFNREGMQYFYAEKDPHVPYKDIFDDVDSEFADQIPPHIYRWFLPREVTLSNNDRGHQMKLGDDRLTITGEAGYCVARATHSVMYGKWYYEIELIEQPHDSHTRVGWGQPNAHLQASLGYNKFGYSFRSLKGTKFHEAHGMSYFREGYGKGDVVGCLIELPERYEFDDPIEASRLPPTRKDASLLSFKGHIFFEEKEDNDEALKRIKPLIGSKITFFKNGVSCGTAFENIYDGTYYPAIAVYGNATVRCNFGPNFKYPPPAGIKPMSDRVDEMSVELALADALFLADKSEDLIRDTEHRSALLGVRFHDKYRVNNL